MEQKIELPVGRKTFILIVKDNDDLELYVDNCLRKQDLAEGSHVLYVWTNIELDWEEHRFVEARFHRSSRQLQVTVNREEVLSETLS
ncbi:MAG: hypothetical protein OXG24_09200 [Gammaproteobacteria bacterium]|nr:hypothetical protein [Gammaproteobacteria bacterium]